MFEKKIKFNDTKDIQEFVKAADKCDFDIDIVSGCIFVDAKSFLGVLALGFARELTVKYGDENHNFEHILNRLCVA